MNRHLIVLTGIILLLFGTACGSDEPADEVWYAQIPMVNHATDTETGGLYSCQVGVLYAELNMTTMTTDITYSLGFGNGTVTLSLTNAPMTRVENGLMVSLAGPVRADNHTFTDINAFIDTRQTGYTQHYIQATVDERYELNGLFGTMAFAQATSEVSTAAGRHFADHGGTYAFTITSLREGDERAEVTLSGIDVFPLDNGVTYDGLTVEPTAEGLFIHTGEEGIVPTAGGSSRLTALEAHINMHERTFTASYAIEGCATVVASGSMR